MISKVVGNLKCHHFRAWNIFQFIILFGAVSRAFKSVGFWDCCWHPVMIFSVIPSLSNRNSVEGPIRENKGMREWGKKSISKHIKLCHTGNEDLRLNFDNTRWKWSPSHHIHVSAPQLLHSWCVAFVYMDANVGSRLKENLSCPSGDGEFRAVMVSLLLFSSYKLHIQNRATSLWRRWATFHWWLS